MFTCKRKSKAASSWGYRIHDGASQFRFQLQGPLASADVPELDQCWRTAASTINGRPLIIDMTAVTSVDKSGRELLDRWKQAGASFVEAPQSRARSRVSAALPWLAAALVLLFAVTLRAAEIATPAAANQAMDKYLANLETNRPWSTETVEIEASLPKLKEKGRLSAVRRLFLGKPQYQVFESDGSRTVKQQVIARYLSAETTAASLAPSSVAVTPANYEFHYAGATDLGGGTAYVFQITPRKKRDGLLRGVIWIDGQSGSAIRLSGYLVKRPSIFIKRVDLTREVRLHDGVVEARVTHLALETRLVGLAQLTIQERPCVTCTTEIAQGFN